MRIWVATTVLLISGVSPAIAQNETAASGHVGHTDRSAPASAMLLDGYGSGGFPVTTAVPQAQAYFDNGMQLAHAFAHEAGVAAMREARRLDPGCAMCVWGEAWADGPTINFGKEGKELKALAKLARKADRMARQNGNALERQLTAALVQRYRQGGGGKAGDLQFAIAMQQISEANPTSDALGTIAADAWLQAPAPDDAAGAMNARRSMAMLEKILARNPEYSPAIHFYIHAAEWVDEPRRAEPFADRLAKLAPKASHLVHMPSHTFYWVGRYREAGLTNRKAVELGIAQAKAMSSPPPEGVFGLPYHSHNVVFGLGGALMAGDGETALWLARPLVESAGKRGEASAYSQALAGGGYVAMALHADPAELLAVPEPKLPILKGMWHYARGEARYRKGDAAGLAAELAAIVPSKLVKTKENSWEWAGNRSLEVARAVLSGRISELAGDRAKAAIAYDEAARLQDDKDYRVAADPPLWWYPVARDAARARLAAGDLAGARKSAEAALRLRPLDPGAVAVLATLDSPVAAR